VLREVAAATDSSIDSDGSVSGAPRVAMGDEIVPVRVAAPTRRTTRATAAATRATTLSSMATTRSLVAAAAPMGRVNAGSRPSFGTGGSAAENVGTLPKSGGAGSHPVAVVALAPVNSDVEVEMVPPRDNHMAADDETASNGGAATEDAALMVAERARMRAGRKRWFTEVRDSRRAEDTDEHVGGPSRDDGSFQDARRRRGGKRSHDFAAGGGDGDTQLGGASGRRRRDPDAGSHGDLIRPDAVGLSRPNRPKASRVPENRGPRARASVPPPSVAGAALAARELGIQLPRRLPATVAAATVQDRPEEDEEEDAPPSARAGTSAARGGDAPPVTGAGGGRATRGLAGGCSGRSRLASVPTIDVPPELSAAVTSEQKISLRAAIRHSVRERVRHYMSRPAFADDVYHGDKDASILFRKAVERTFGCSAKQAMWLLTQRLPAKLNRGRGDVERPPPSLPCLAPPPETPDGAGSQAQMPPSPVTQPAIATATKTRVRRSDLVRGICYRARSNVHHAIGRATARAWMGGAGFDDPVVTEDVDVSGKRLDPLTSIELKAQWWLRGRRYLMTVRGRGGFLEAFRVFKTMVSCASDPEESLGEEREEAGEGAENAAIDEGDQTVVVAWRAQLAWMSAKVRTWAYPSGMPPSPLVDLAATGNL